LHFRGRGCILSGTAPTWWVKYNKKEKKKKYGPQVPPSLLSFMGFTMNNIPLSEWTTIYPFAY
jgi:hypothetical protein